MTKNLQSSHQVLDSVLGYLLVGVLGPIINTSVFQNLAVRITRHPVFYIDYAFHKSLIWSVSSPGVKKYRAEYHQHNSES